MVDISWATLIDTRITLEWNFPRRVATKKFGVELEDRFGGSSLFHKGVDTVSEIDCKCRGCIRYTRTLFSLQLSFFGADEACGICQDLTM